MGRCDLCRHRSTLIDSELGLCLDCIRSRAVEARAVDAGVHDRIRHAWGLPGAPPRCRNGVRCDRCVNRCRMGDGEQGYCGLRRNVHGRLAGAAAARGNLSWYHDPLPTNCVADAVCPGGTGCGYPRYACRNGPEIASIAGFIASLNPDIPYRLLAFHPDYHMTDLGRPSWEQARECIDAARQAGLRRVSVGNRHLLG